MYSDESKYKEARKRVKIKQEFYRHLGTYFVMSLFFFLLNAVTSFGNWWFYWPMLGWGLAVLFHYVDVFGVPGVDPMSAEWEERQIREEMKRLNVGEGHRRRQAGDDRLELKPLDRRKRTATEKAGMNPNLSNNRIHQSILSTKPRVSWVALPILNPLKNLAAFSTAPAVGVTA